jgi:hypothetical protein
MYKFDEVLLMQWFLQMYKITNFHIVEVACIWRKSKRLFLRFRVLHPQEHFFKICLLINNLLLVVYKESQRRTPSDLGRRDTKDFEGKRK